MKFSFSEKGFSLAETMISLTVASLIMAGVSNYFSQASKKMTQMQSIESVDSIHRRLREMAEKPTSLYRTIADVRNLTFKQCIEMGTGAVAGSCNVQNLTPLYVLNPNSKTSLLAGPPAQPVYYSPTGGPCAGTNDCSSIKNFPIEAIAGFTANNAGVTFYYCVRLRNGDQKVKFPFASVPGLKSFQDPKYFPSCSAFYKGSDAVNKPLLKPTHEEYDPVQMSISFQKFKPCPANEYVTGIGSDGAPICGVVTQSANSKLAEQATFAYAATTAKTADFASTVRGGDCPAGSMVTGINPDTTPKCRAVPKANSFRCPGSSTVKGYDASGAPICSAPQSTAFDTTTGVLQGLHNECEAGIRTGAVGNKMGSWSAPCQSAANRYCKEKGFLSGVISEEQNGNFSVNCFGTEK
jgi:hypothetical protein